MNSVSTNLHNSGLPIPHPAPSGQRSGVQQIGTRNPPLVQVHTTARGIPRPAQSGNGFSAPESISLYAARRTRHYVLVDLPRDLPPPAATFTTVAADCRCVRCFFLLFPQTRLEHRVDGSFSANCIKSIPRDATVYALRVYRGNAFSACISLL